MTDLLILANMRGKNIYEMTDFLMSDIGFSKNELIKYFDFSVSDFKYGVK